MLNDKYVREFKEILEKKTGKSFSDEEVFKQANNLYNLVKLLLDMSQIEFEWEQRLKTEPKGFSVSGNGRTCRICKNNMNEDENWYDKWGLKCKVCQKAINKKIIPGSVLKNEDTWYSEYDLKDAFNLTKKHLNNWIGDGLIKARIIENNGNTYCRIFLIKDNQGFLPPKKMIKSRLVKETIDGKDWYHSEPWYKFVDPFVHLKEYKIMNFMQRVKQDIDN